MIVLKPFFYLEAFEKDVRGDGLHTELYIRYYGTEESWEEKAPFKPYCYVSGKKDNYDMRCAKSNYPLKKMEYDLPEYIADIKHDYETWEGDVTYERRLMMDKGLEITKGRVAYIDIETDDSDGASDPEVHEIISIGIVFDDGEEVFLNDVDESYMLDRFIKLMLRKRVAIIVTWNGGEDVWETRSFDLPYMAKRYKSQFEFDQYLRHIAYIDLYRRYKNKMKIQGHGLAGGYSLENVSQHELGRGKVKHEKKIGELSKEELREYNMMDVILLKELDEKLGLTDLEVSIAQTCNLRLTAWYNNKRRREMTPVYQLDHLFLKECKKYGLAWPTMEWRFNAEHEKIEGALVLEPKVGLHQGVQNYDVKSMYPSIIINERYSPDKDRKILPSLLHQLLEKRKELKQKLKETGDKKYDIWQYAYKVVANVAYGAMSNPYFRAYDRDVAQSITRKGQALLSGLRDYAEKLGYEVVYGDTDSVFVKVDRKKAPILSKILNRKIRPYVLEEGEYYDSMLFFGTKDLGTKKRYAGLLDGRVYSKGLEVIRSDYAVLAREMQYVILGKILSGVSITECRKCMSNLEQCLRTGKYDDWLILSKGVNKLEDYVTITKSGKKKRLLPHIRALEIAYAKGMTNLYDIDYVFTKGESDVMPCIDGQIPKDVKLDYEKYWQSQVMAVINPIFKSIKTSFQKTLW